MSAKLAAISLLALPPACGTAACEPTTPRSVEPPINPLQCITAEEANALADSRGTIWVQRFLGPYHKAGYQVVDFDGNATPLDLPFPGPLAFDKSRLATSRESERGIEV